MTQLTGHDPECTVEGCEMVGYHADDADDPTNAVYESKQQRLTLAAVSFLSTDESQALPDGPPRCDTCEDSGAVGDPAGYDDIVSCPDCSDSNCPACGGPGAPLGTLGTLAHFRCVNCGTDFHEEVR